MRSLALLLLPCVIAAVVHLWWVTDKTAFFSDLKSAGSRNPEHDVLVGVLSARHHHDLREAIRDTWLGYLRDHSKFQNRVLVKFIIGQHGCAIPEEDREDPYSCTLLNFTEPVAGQDMAVLSVPDASVLVLSDVSAISLDFKVLHSVVITQLGVFSGGAQHHFRGNVTVKLFQVEQEKAVVTASFTALSPGTYVEGIWYKAVEQFILPKGFEGTLLWESQDLTALMALNVSKIQLNNGGGVLKLGCTEEGTLPHRSAVGFPGLAGGFTFSVYNVDVLKEMLRGRAGRQQAHVARLREEDKALQEESRRAIRNTDFSLLLKTDDDCYINMDAVLMKIDRKTLTRSNLWWGNFRQNWAVDRLGKWQEVEYASPVYPAFSCGSGYVVSRDLVVWLASNAEKLKAYQGEDVSMGIWMAAVGPKKYQDPGWLCEKECYVDMLSSPQHTVEELHSLWDQKSACGDPCGCAWSQD
ncbi:UDP-GalNAc:beta-1,3-N-acetylgalactosaminyltransferase 2 isoform X3 [Pygocentrus nattereri]|uniref:UDP-GalNAc:beta-1, 3-N-acetylgalactosaminyltransferase 2 isoform X3 n=1 Tax=Pygocentrus nattereri TaxID=42514 RepID=UPI0008143CAD|nr:UDP-GalNAc:beta-1,3-N-acetylgalactosaminyltransferase 2 isoform X3 [Pygocentrus nattereri]